MNYSQILLLYRRENISRRRLLVLVCLLRNRRLHIQKNAPYSEWRGAAFRLNDFTDRECLAYFCFWKPDIARLRLALRIKAMVKKKAQDVVSGDEALCILLKRFSYANCWIDLRLMFGRREGTLSRIFYHVLRHFDGRFSFVIQRVDVSWLTEADFHLYTGAIAAKEGVLPASPPTALPPFGKGLLRFWTLTIHTSCKDPIASGKNFRADPFILFFFFALASFTFCLLIKASLRSSDKSPRICFRFVDFSSVPLRFRFAALSFSNEVKRAFTRNGQNRADTEALKFL